MSSVSLKQSQIFKGLKRLIIFAVLKFKSYKVNNSILICSYPRSGSTWIMELVNALPKTIVNWEPLHVEKGVVPRQLFLGEKPCIDANFTTDIYKHLFDEILRFKIFNKWTIWYCGIKKIRNSKFVITKFVRANSLLPWLVTNFQFKHKPVFILRHPIPTCMSVIKSFTNNSKDLLNFTQPNSLNSDRYNSHLNYINALKTRLEQQIAIWCIDNVYIINHKDQRKWITVHYESFMLDPKEEFMKLIEQWRFNIENIDLNRVNFSKPSRTVYVKDDLKQNANHHIEKFLLELNQVELQRIQDIFDYFNVKKYSAFSAYPIKNE